MKKLLILTIGMLVSTSAYSDIYLNSINVTPNNTTEIVVIPNSQPTIRERASFLITDEYNTPILDVLEAEVQPSSIPNVSLENTNPIN